MATKEKVKKLAGGIAKQIATKVGGKKLSQKGKFTPKTKGEKQAGSYL